MTSATAPGTATAGGVSIDVASPSPDRLTVSLAGDWRLGASLPSSGELESRIGTAPGLRTVELDGSGIGEWDSTLLTFLLPIARSAEQHSAELDSSRLPQGARRLLELALAVPEREGAARAAERIPFVSRVGTAALDAMEGAVSFVSFLGEATLSLGRFVTGRAQYRRSDLMLTIQQCGVDALPIVTLISVLIGLILAFVGAMQLKLFGAEIFVADLVGIGMAREMGAMMAAIIMAGRTGAAFAAQLGTMTVNEEIDALRTMGIDPMDFLVLPRMLALILMLPLLSVYAVAVGIAGGAAVAITSFDLSPVQYWSQTVFALNLTHFGVGIVKAGIFGVLIALAGCLRGMECGRSASAVGEAATSAVVTAIVLIIVLDALVTVVTTLLEI